MHETRAKTRRTITQANDCLGDKIDVLLYRSARIMSLERELNVLPEKGLRQIVAKLERGGLAIFSTLSTELVTNS